MKDDPDSAAPRSSILGRGLAVAVLAGLAIGLLWAVPDKAHVVTLLKWFKTAGPVGWVGFAGIYLVVTIFLLPTSVFTVGGGFLFGPVTGFFVVWVAENIAALACLVIGRYLARPTVERLVSKHTLLAAIDQAVQDRGFSLLILLRLSPLIPFGILNYGISLTGMSAGRYVLATLLGTALPAFLYVYVGSTLTKLNDVLNGEGGDSGPEMFIYWGGLVATVVATIVVTRATRNVLAERLAAAGIEER